MVARKPLAGTVAANVLEWGTGALNIDGTRVGGEPWKPVAPNAGGRSGGVMGKATEHPGGEPHTAGRWPANTVLTHAAGCQQVGTGTVQAGDPDRFAKTDGGAFAAFSQSAPVVRTGNLDGTETVPVFVCAPGCPAADLNQQSGTTKGSGKRVEKARPRNNGIGLGDTTVRTGKANSPDNFGDGGGASRFFTAANWDPEWDSPIRYVAKPSRRERNAGLDGTVAQSADPGALRDGARTNTQPRANTHPTVKPVALIRWLVRLGTPPGGVVLDPFLGSGTTAVAAILEGHPWLGCEMTDEYVPIITGRVEHAQQQVAEAQPKLFG